MSRGSISPLAWAVIWWLASCIYLAFLYQPFTPDSYVYVAAARTALDSGHFGLPFASTEALTLPAPLSNWPPGYPALIALASTFGLDPWTAARWVAALCVSLVVLLGALWLKDKPGAHLGLAVACVCNMTSLVATTAWSEGLFVLSLGLAFAGVIVWNSNNATRLAPWLICLGLACALFTRHAGWFVVPVIACHTLRTNQGRLARWGVILLAVLPAAVWVALHAPGIESDFTFSMHRLVRSTGETAASFGKLVVAPWSDWVFAQALFGAGVLCGLVVLQWRTRPSQSAFSRLAWHLGWSLVLGTWLVGVANPASFFVTDRLVWPGWAFLALAAGSSLRLHQSRAPLLVFALVIVTQTAGVIRLPDLEPRRLDSKQDFQHSGKLLANQVVVSNEAWRAWRLAGCSGYYLPRTSTGANTFAPDTLVAWSSRRGVRYLVWFHDGLGETESLRRYGPLSASGYGKPPADLELVARDPACDTYLIQGTGR